MQNRRKKRKLRDPSRVGVVSKLYLIGQIQPVVENNVSLRRSHAHPFYLAFTQQQSWVVTTQSIMACKARTIYCLPPLQKACWPLVQRVKYLNNRCALKRQERENRRQEMKTPEEFQIEKAHTPHAQHNRRKSSTHGTSQNKIRTLAITAH